MKESLKYLSLITQVGLTVLLIIIFFTLLGVYLDRFLNTGALFSLLFVLGGCIAAIWSAYQMILKTLPRDGEKK